MNPLRYVPAPADLLAGARGTKMLLQVRWRMVRGVLPKASVWAGATMMIAVVFVFTNLGTLIRRAAEEGESNAASAYAINYIMSLERGQLGSFGALALGSVIVAAIFSPLTGVGGSSLFPASELVGISPHRLHRYFDTLVAQAVSVVGVFQLVTLTALGALLTMDGSRGPGLLIAWAMWPMVCALAVAISWAVDFCQRMYGRGVRWASATVLAAVTGVAILLDAHHGQTLFGVGDVFASAIRKATLGEPAAALPVFATTVAVTAALILVGATFTLAALSKPDIPLPVPKSFLRWKISTNPTFALAQILLLQVVRTGAIRRPILAVAIAAPPAVFLTGGSTTVISTLVITIPLAVCLAWGVNIFGVIGPGMTWLATQPNVNRKLLGVAVGVQLFIVTVLCVGVWGPAALFGVINLQTCASVAAATLVTTLVTTRSAASKSVNRPFHVSVAQRGDQIVPPLTSVNYTLRFVLGGGQLGILALSLNSRPFQLAVVAYIAVWTTYRFLRLARQWAGRSVQARVVASVAA